LGIRWVRRAIFLGASLLCRGWTIPTLFETVRYPICIIIILSTLLVNMSVSWSHSLSLRPMIYEFSEQFSNGITIISLYLNPLPGSTAPPIESSIFQVMKEASLLYCLPDNPFFLPNAGDPDTGHAVQEATYACLSSYVSSFFFFQKLIYFVRLWMDLCAALLQSTRSCLSPAQEYSRRGEFHSRRGAVGHQEAVQGGDVHEREHSACHFGLSRFGTSTSLLFWSLGCHIAILLDG
jgi:hypothetical protein